MLGTGEGGGRDGCIGWVSGGHGGHLAGEGAGSDVADAFG